MLLLRKEQSSDVCDYSPIARAFYKMDKTAEGKIKKKFDVALYDGERRHSFL